MAIKRLARTKLVLGLAAALLLVAAGARAHWSHREARLQMVRGAIRYVADRVHLERAFVAELFRHANHFKPGGYNVLVHNSGQPYDFKLFDVLLHTTVRKFGQTYDVWLFKCGVFENEGKLGPEFWAFSGPNVYVIDEGEEAIFYNSRCADPNFRFKFQKLDD